IPIIVMHDQDTKPKMDAPVNGYIKKPLNPEMLFNFFLDLNQNAQEENKQIAS
ncbi:MAG: hypothetical protein HQK75_13205, partial [Candidatus Magnetomorum sp.]|nr:hypothetical protein [Candidatus Magnetomorum sp.]